MSQRTEKVASVIRRVIAKPIADLARENNAGLASVNEIIVSPDLQNAKVFVSCFGGKINSLQFISIVENHKGKIKSAISRDAILKFIPELKFFYDDTLDKMGSIQKVLDKIHEDPNYVSKLDETEETTNDKL